MLHNSIKVQQSKNLPVRIILLKPRQVGWSTWTEAEIFCNINRIPNRRAQVVSADTDSTNDVFKMAQIFQEEMPARYKRATKRSNKKEIVYSAPHRSELTTATAGKDVLGRGGTTQDLHISEFAFWPNAKEQLNAVTKRVPNEPGTMIIIESTANGVGGAFYDMFTAAMKKRKKNPDDYSGFIPVFFAWYQFPEYQTAIPEGVKLEYDDDEKWLKSNFGLCDEQLYWRRLQIEECGGDVNLFKQEYPATPDEAFQTTGRNVFSQTSISKLRKSCKNTLNFLFDDINDKIRPVEVSNKFNSWKIWVKPEQLHEYSMGIDTCEGRASDPADARSDPDRHGVVIFDRHTQEIVAQFHGDCEQRELGIQCLMAAKYYNDAWVAPEMPMAKTVLDVFIADGYENIYQRQKHDEQYEQLDTDDLGWKTTTITRPWLVEGLIFVIRDGDITIYSEDIIEEMSTFIRDKNGKPIHQPGKHDDLLFGLMIAIQVHIRCPLNVLPYSYSSTYESDSGVRQSVICSGAIDDFDPAQDEEDEYNYTY